MSWTRWKAFEKQVADVVRGTRRTRVNYAESVGDVIHPKYSIECKYGKQIPNKALIGKRCVFLDKAFAQARGYAPKKKAMVCLKKPGMRGFIMIIGYPRCTDVRVINLVALLMLPLSLHLLGHGLVC